MPSPIKLIVGLGNPGPEYIATRHNAGFWFLDNLAVKYGVVFSSEPKFRSEITRINSHDVDCRLLKPATYMNESGGAIQAIMAYYKLGVEEIVVVHDEIDFEPGTVRIKSGGGHAGHNGIRDIINRIDSKDFLRLRIGVGHPGHKDKTADSVLSRPSIEHQGLIEDAIETALSVMPLIFKGEYSKVMAELHTNE